MRRIIPDPSMAVRRGSACPGGSLATSTCSSSRQAVSSRSSWLHSSGTNLSTVPACTAACTGSTIRRAVVIMLETGFSLTTVLACAAACTGPSDWGAVSCELQKQTPKTNKPTQLTLPTSGEVGHKTRRNISAAGRPMHMRHHSMDHRDSQDAHTAGTQAGCAQATCPKS